MTKIWAKTDLKKSFFAQGAKQGLGRSPPQELEEGPCSGPHLLVTIKAIPPLQIHFIPLEPKKDRKPMFRAAQTLGGPSLHNL